MNFRDSAKRFVACFVQEDNGIVDDAGEPVPVVPVPKKPLDYRKVLVVILGVVALLALVLNINSMFGDSGSDQPRGRQQERLAATMNNEAVRRAQVQAERDQAALKKAQQDAADAKKATDSLKKDAGIGDANKGNGRASHGVGSGSSDGYDQDSARHRSEELSRARSQSRIKVVDFTTTPQQSVPVSGISSVPNSPGNTLASPKPIDLGTQASSQDEKAAKDSNPNPLADFDQYSGKLYRLFEGTFLEVVVTNQINGDAAGPIIAMVTTPQYSNNYQKLLIPKGTRLIGDVRAVNERNESRLFVAFHRMIFTDGFSVSLDKFTGLSQIGDVGLRDKVNRHLAIAFGASLAIGAIGGLSQIGGGYSGLGYDPMTAIRSGIGMQMGQEATQILDRFLSRLPTITIRPGVRSKIYISSDCSLPAFDDHKMDPNL